ncbi:MAG: NAD-dependent epimerase/dehydratase family protein [Anaerolineae bacterium]|nr:NAD-dependent epimerase/dehydratase family protein [Anaerolineae bacterium]
MKLLFIGGTVFLGRATVEAALARGHEITLFNRGKSMPDLFPGVEKLFGDRDGGLDALRGRQFDAAIDTCGYVPRVVRQSARLLADQVDRYVFVSSLSAYAEPSEPGADESAPLATMRDETIEEITGETYGPLKTLCEAEVEKALPGRALLIRPGLIVGPHDRTDRFSYWPYRVAQGGEVLAPGRPARLVQFIDVRDLAEWIVRLLEGGQTGVYNAVGAPLPMSAVLDVCRTVSGSDAAFTWVDDAFLVERKVGMWIELPLWIPESDPTAPGFFAYSNTRAIANGLTFRPLEETVRATLDWLATRPADHAWRAGMSRERERELLQAWK